MYATSAVCGEGECGSLQVRASRVWRSWVPWVWLADRQPVRGDGCRRCGSGIGEVACKCRASCAWRWLSLVWLGDRCGGLQVWGLAGAGHPVRGDGRWCGSGIGVGACRCGASCAWRWLSLVWLGDRCGGLQVQGIPCAGVGCRWCGMCTGVGAGVLAGHAPADRPAQLSASSDGSTPGPTASWTSVRENGATDSEQTRLGGTSASRGLRVGGGGGGCKGGAGRSAARWTAAAAPPASTCAAPSRVCCSSAATSLAPATAGVPTQPAARACSDDLSPASGSSAETRLPARLLGDAAAPLSAPAPPASPLRGTCPPVIGASPSDATAGVENASDTVLPTSERSRVCSMPDSPLARSVARVCGRSESNGDSWLTETSASSDSVGSATTAACGGLGAVAVTEALVAAARRAEKLALRPACATCPLPQPGGPTLPPPPLPLLLLSPECPRGVWVTSTAGSVTRKL
eukprot:363345-Chlamydomonas_euryale.AAC.4